ncbi:MAG TPA: AraC family transcriptional regulator [Candidatus Brachybacterium merdigallinarum]|jgi:AraC-like DNA-binding protein|nr:AraC family transcriptional regulator [Candidatus Brachybacterium merdigallinarum]
MTVAAAPVERRLPRLAAGSVEVPYVMISGQEAITQDTVWAEHSHPTHELLWNEYGASTATIDSRVWTITPSIGLWIPAGEVHSGFTPAGILHRAAQFSPARSPLLATGPVAVAITPLLRLLLDRLITADLTDHSRDVTIAMVMDVLAPSDQQLLLPISEHPLLADIIDSVRRDPADPTSLEQWARRQGVAARTITRTFEAETGMTFRSWVATARAHHAVAMMALGLSFEEIAERVGFRSTSAFTTAFRRTTGLTPGQFRRSAPADPPRAP